ncbi:helix-turn-helix domain-containing protein [Gordonia sp. HY285]|uniref:helix-turn-helix transcriptional regulator n=1 Tax=Gordonia liuliyuniae TaxID=2911517 RepID=UPI001F4407DC|nr:helix-turn-helix transcriptional regulator [Gordonia liuliyuniae]MCF8609440.1 helix-turn-helix domain-containing protein [Gordonia liuliyuniae]
MQRTEALCRILKSYRVLSGLTQLELADRLGVVQSLVSKVESRERRLDLIEMQEYLKPLGRTVHDVLADLERYPVATGRSAVEELAHETVSRVVDDE